jgi:hypothetical protein
LAVVELIQRRDRDAQHAEAVDVDGRDCEVRGRGGAHIVVLLMPMFV